MVSPSHFLFIFLCITFTYKVVWFVLKKILPLPKKNVQVPSLNHPTSTSASGSSKLYDVFLSFRGKDVRNTFVDHLYSALVDRHIRTYKDDETLAQGDSIGPSLLNAIEESKIAVVIFSKNFADSSWCLDEVAYIMQCRDQRGQIVMPIFYDVHPSEVRQQIGHFGKAFSKQEAKNATKAQVWRKALVDASKIAGWEPKRITNGNESEAIKTIVDTIFVRLFPVNSDVNEEFVGMSIRLQDLVSLLDTGSGGVRMVGIWGVGGSGKTTLATSIFMKISHDFQGSCIVENVREETNKYGLKKVQENILSAIFKRKVKVQSVEEGKLKLKSMLCHRKVLVLLDDVDKLDQLDSLAGSHNWFGSGSRIVITTRDEHLLRTHNVNKVYPVKLLSDNESIQLFKRHAYNEKAPIENFETLSLHVVSYAAGLPLALKVLGAFLYDKEKNEWMSTLTRLKDVPKTEIFEILKISYDGLTYIEKELFLDIACFWRRKRKFDAMEIFEACDFHPEIGIKVLRQKALITVVDDKYDGEIFDMHDMVQEMGHHIVRGEYPKNPEKHSRVWKKEEIHNMYIEDAAMVTHSSRFRKIISNMKKLRSLSVSTRVSKSTYSTHILFPLAQKNDKIEVITYDCNNLDHSSHFCKIVSNMKELRWLSVCMCLDKYPEGPSFLSNELRYFQWNGYPATRFPDSFQPMKLVVLKLKYSRQTEVWRGWKHLPYLKVLELSSMYALLSTPDFDGPRLQELKLHACKELEKIHSSLENHARLVYLSVVGCHKLKKFPTLVQMKNLKFLLVENCNLKNGGIPSGIGELYNLQELSLSGNDFSQLDFSTSQLTRLKFLDVSRCTKLLKLPELSSSLAMLIANECKSLKTFGDCHKNCEWLSLVSLWRAPIINDGCKLLQSMIEGKAIENRSMVLILKGVAVAKGFTPLLKGKRCRLQLPDNWCNDYCGFLMCTVLSLDPGHDNYVSICMKQVMGGMDSRHDVVWEDDASDGDMYTRVSYVSFGSLRHTTWWDQRYKALLFEIESGFMDYDGFGVRLVAKKNGSVVTETSTHDSSFVGYTFDYTPRFRIEHDSTSVLKFTTSHIRFVT